MPEQDADVIVVGAGPGGSSAAYHLATHGARVLLLEKCDFPREKVCGDGLTPRAVKQLIRMGVDFDQPGWLRNRGLRVIGGGMRLELDWPALASYPDYGLTRTRYDFDDMLAQRAVSAGADLRTSTNVTGPVLDDDGRVVGVTRHRRTGAAHLPRPDRGRGRRRLRPAAAGAGPGQARGPADGRRRSPLLPLPGQARRRLPGVLARAAQQPRSGDRCCRATAGSSGWETAGSTSAWACSTPPPPSAHQLPALLNDWLSRPRPRVGLRDEANAEGRIRGAALPMGFNRVPHYTRGVMLVGDSAAWSTPSTAKASRTRWSPARSPRRSRVQALARPTAAGRERVLRDYPRRAEGALRRLLPARRDLREADRQPAGDAAGHQARHAAPDADAVRAQADGEPDRSARRGRHGPDHQRDGAGGPALYEASR